MQYSLVKEERNKRISFLCRSLGRNRKRRLRKNRKIKWISAQFCSSSWYNVNRIALLSYYVWNLWEKWQPLGGRNLGSFALILKQMTNEIFIFIYLPLFVAVIFSVYACLPWFWLTIIVCYWRIGPFFYKIAGEREIKEGQTKEKTQICYWR